MVPFTIANLLPFCVISIHYSNSPHLENGVIVELGLRGTSKHVLWFFLNDLDLIESIYQVSYMKIQLMKFETKLH